MKLSEAIRLNGMSRPQGFGSDSVKSITEPCAIGGALQAVGRQDPFSEPRNYAAMYELWPWVNRENPRVIFCKSSIC